MLGRTDARVKRTSVALGLVLALVLAVPAAGQGSTATADVPPVAPDFATRSSGKHLSVADLPAPRRFVTQHKAEIGGKPLSYTATAEETYITSIAGEPVGRFFTFSYVKNGPVDRDRPVLFVFNGGPGSASLWLHMGALGPKRAYLDRGVNPSNVPPFGLVENGSSPLDVTDMVFIDPIGTGFSHAVGEAQDADFAGVDADVDSVARFIEAWLGRNGRFHSPKFVLGESYGGYRAAVLPRALMGGLAYGGVMRGITLDGVIIVGSPLSAGASQPTTPARGIDRTVGDLIPGMAITARYHKRVPTDAKSTEALYEEVARFVRTDYAEALQRLKAGILPEPAQAAIAARLAGYTGVPAETWIRNKLQINPPQYGAMALADEGLDIGLYDSRYTLPLKNRGVDFVADDPAMTQYVPGMIAAFHEMLKDQLKVEMPIPYEAIVWEGVFSRWNHRRAGVTPTQTYAGDLAVAMRRQPRMRAMLVSGYYDLLATPLAMRNAVEQAGVPMDRVALRTFESGHMSYLGNTIKQFGDSVRRFVVETMQRADTAASSHD